MMTNKKTALFSILMVIASACEKGDKNEPSEPAEPADSPDLTDSSEPPELPLGDIVLTVNIDEAGAPFDDLFRSVNLDAGKQMADETDYSRI